jgi:hypothetical protein
MSPLPGGAAEPIRARRYGWPSRREGRDGRDPSLAPDAGHGRSASQSAAPVTAGADSPVRTAPAENVAVPAMIAPTNRKGPSSAARAIKETEEAEQGPLAYPPHIATVFGFVP